MRILLILMLLATQAFPQWGHFGAYGRQPTDYSGLGTITVDALLAGNAAMTRINVDTVRANTSIGTGVVIWYDTTANNVPGLTLYNSETDVGDRDVLFYLKSAAADWIIGQDDGGGDVFEISNAATLTADAAISASEGGNNSVVVIGTGASGSNFQVETSEAYGMREVNTPTNVADKGALFTSNGDGGLVAGEVYAMDEAGNTSIISPHNHKGEWIFHSVNQITGKYIRVDMEFLLECLARKVECETGRKYFHRGVVKDKDIN